MLLKEYRVCMPLSVEEYHIGQLYMIAKHSYEESADGEGVQVLISERVKDPQHGSGQYTGKQIYLYSRLPKWAKCFVPKFFHITEKVWNFYPFTKAEYTCSFLPKFSVHVETRYEDNAGTSDNCLKLDQDQLQAREVVFLDVVTDQIAEKNYKKSEDLKLFHSEKTGRGPYAEGWKSTSEPIMCSYKSVNVKYDAWCWQTRVERYVHNLVSGILLLGHRQAVAWIDEWYGRSLEDVRKYEGKMQKKTNTRLAEVLMNL